ncbi:hypothetical protein PQ478_08625 [Alkalihalophilus pseudofirmus]|uniref:hypothetical protein n=1 Tax=Alkalihalophilus pseudofirmus TaxID=79885 RepID=UPI00259B0928|nr:hypothetical protein [Alkalihalophilus pseudofirmus]WEG18533.1 hypothetical protein PQ478_08625 [Alkalihalophilus pseudofirmus]
MKLMLDTKEYKSKPVSAGEVTSRVVRYPTDLSPESLANEIVKGKSFVAGYLNNKVNGKIKRRVDCWTSQQIICMDFDDNYRIEEAINDFKDIGMFIYKTFNHTDEHHKIRVVLALDKPVTNYNQFYRLMNELHKLYPQCDQSCKDGSRLFYGGKECIILNYNNRIKLEDYIDTSIDYSSIKTTANTTKSNNTNTKQVNITSSQVQVVTSVLNNILPCNHHNLNMIKLIKNKDIEALQRILSPSPVVFYTYTEVYDYIKQQDLRLLLGLGEGSCSCLFHEDSNPSANIFYGDEVQGYIYKCFSEKCTFKTGTIRKVIERILGCNKVEGLNFLMKLYRIELKETDWQKEQRRIIDENIRYLMSIDLQEEYPELYIRIKRYLGDLTILHNIAKENLPAEHYSDEKIEYLFYASVRHIANIKGIKNIKRVNDIVSLFAYLGLIFKKTKDDMPQRMIEDVSKVMSDKKSDKLTFFALPSYSHEIMTFGEEKAVEFKEKHFSMKGWSREMLLRSLGDEEANRVYPLQKGKQLSKQSECNVSKLETYCLDLLNENGWIIESEIVNNVVLSFGGKEYKKIQIKKMLGEFIDKYDLKRSRLNKKIKNLLNVEYEGSPFIIYK